MRVVAFDIGGVLRPVYLPGANTIRNFGALRDLYRSFCQSPDWYVVITTKRPAIKASEESVKAELDSWKLPYPDEILICSGSKSRIYEKTRPDLVVDDCDEHIREAQELSITTLKVD